VPLRGWAGPLSCCSCWTWVGAAGTALALFLAGPVTVVNHRARAAAGTAVDSAAALAASGVPGATVVRPRPERPVPRGLLEATVQVGRDDVVLTDRGRELWLPGPANGGVTRAEIGSEAVRLTDAAGREHARLDTELWAPTPDRRQQLHDELRDAGLEAFETPLSARAPGTVAQLLSAPARPSRLLTDEERGDPTTTTPWVTAFVAVLAVGTSIGAVTWHPLAGGLLLAAALALAALSLGDAVRTTRRDRRAVRPASAPAAEVLR
jgi:hypothetical protein